MNVLELIDQLDGLLHNAKSIPLTGEVRVDREAAYKLLDQIRVALPEEIQQARRIIESRDSTRTEVDRETERVLHETRQHFSQ